MLSQRVSVLNRVTPGRVAKGKRNRPVPAPVLTRTRPSRKPALILPRYETPMPEGAADSYGPAIGHWAYKKLGLDPMRWQQHVLDRMLLHDGNGDLLARTALWSTGRQNGKTVDVRVLIGWMLREGCKLPPFKDWASILSCAHDSRQARIPYKKVLADSGGSELILTRFAGIRTPDERLTYDVGTSQSGSQRGESNGLLTWDEVLTAKDWELYEALKPTQAAQRSPLLVLTSSAGFDDSVVLRHFFDRLVRIATGDEKPDPTFYGVWWQSEDPHAGLDWDQIGMANPGLPEGRPTKAALREDYGTMQPEGWSREHLNHWQAGHGTSAFKPGVWASNRLPNPLHEVSGPFALGIGVAKGWERATISVAAVRPDQRIGVEIYRDLRGEVTPGMITAAVDGFNRGQFASSIAFDASSGGAAEFERHGQETGLPYRGFKPGEMVKAEMDVSEMIQAGRWAVDDPLLDFQVAGLAKRFVGADGAFRFTADTQPIDAVKAAALAAHAIAYRGGKPNIW